MYKVKVEFLSQVVDKVIEDMLCSIEYSENILDSDLSINTGICEQYVNIEFKDVDGTFRELALNESLEYYDTIINIYINNQLDNSFYVYNWDIDMSQEIIKVNGRDPSYQFDDISIPLSQLSDYSARYLIQELFSHIDYKYEFADGVYAYCENIFLPDAWYRPNTLYELLNKVCELALLRIYWRKDRFIIDKVVT